MDDDRSSFAKKIEGLHHEENALDRTNPVREKFKAAQEQDNVKPGPVLVETDKQGSQMIRDDAPRLQPTPSGPMRDIPDSYAAATKLGQERDREDEKIRAAIRAKAHEGRGQDKERER